MRRNKPFGRDISERDLCVLSGATTKLAVLSLLFLPPTNAHSLREFSFKITGLKKLQILCVRQNLFKDASGVGAFESKGTLRELVMHDNLLTALPSFQVWTTVYISAKDIERCMELPVEVLSQARSLK